MRYPDKRPLHWVSGFKILVLFDNSDNLVIIISPQQTPGRKKSLLICRFQRATIKSVHLYQSYAPFYDRPLPLPHPLFWRMV